MSTPRRKNKTRLPRLTLLAYSRQELQRFSDAAEKVAAASNALTMAVVALQAQVDRLERRSDGARKANQTRRAPAATLVHPPETGLPDVTMPAQDVN